MDTAPEIVPSEMDNFVRALILGGNASTLVRAHVCPYHLFFSVAGEACKDVDTTPNRYAEYPDTSLYDILSGPSSRCNKMGWLTAAAAAHNKEQHALNGNIDTVWSAQSNGADWYAAYRAAFWDEQGVQIDRLTNDADLIRQACDTSLRCYFSSGTDEFHNVLTNVATAHQFVVVAEDKMGGGGLGTGEGDVRRKEPDPSSEGSVAGSVMSSLREGPSGIRTAGSVVVSDITLRPTDSDGTVAREIKATLSMPEVAIGRYKSRRKADEAETARNVIRAAVDPDESTPLVVPVPEGNRGPALEMCARISRRLKWVRVGQYHIKYATGRVEFITFGKAPLLYGQIIDCPYMTQDLLWGAPRTETADIRELTLKVALMDMQRPMFLPAQRGGVGLGKAHSDKHAAA